MGTRRGLSFSLLAVSVLLNASCTTDTGTPLPKNNTTGSANTTGSGTGAAGSNTTGSGTGAAGDNTTGSGTGAAGDTSTGTGTGAAGDSGGTGAAGSNTTGTGTGAAGSGAGGSGAGGTTGAAGSVMTGTAGAGAAGATGAAGAGGGGKGPTGMSAGCNVDSMIAPGSFVHQTIAVTGVAATVKPATGGASWTMRDYFIRLPSGYDKTKPYPVLFGGGGCGGSLVSNGNGAFSNSNANAGAIQIGMAYVWPQGGGACFDDNGTDTPDLPYFDSMLAEIESKYCVDKGKVFVGGYSSGGWESYMLGLARGGVVRGISPAAGGLRMMRPPGSNIPIAALLLTGGNDTANPAEGPTGSDAAMSLILQINGCQGTATVPWETPCTGCGCNRYTGCPAAFPVVRCRPPGQGHTDGGGAFKSAIWATWMSLPTPP
jgi:poly(3-hydroxybutyrate) depolymerase